MGTTNQIEELLSVADIMRIFGIKRTTGLSPLSLTFADLFCIFNKLSRPYL
jgi:hypothetical protein